MKMQFQEQLDHAWHSPAFSSLLANRRDLMFVAAFGVLHIGFSMAGITFWNCPIRAATGVPCPGCGLTRASLELLHGDVSASFQTHAFASVALATVFLMLLIFILPESLREKWVTAIRNFETRSGSTAWIISFLFFYWAIRLSGILPFPTDF